MVEHRDLPEHDQSLKYNQETDKNLLFFYNLSSFVHLYLAIIAEVFYILSKRNLLFNDLNDLQKPSYKERWHLPK